MAKKNYFKKQHLQKRAFFSEKSTFLGTFSERGLF